MGGHPFPDSPTGDLIAKRLHDLCRWCGTAEPEMPEEVDGVIQRAQTKIQPGALRRCAGVTQDFRTALQPLVVVAPEIPEQEIYNPYKGLRAFQEADAEDFFGREALVGQLIARLASTRYFPHRLGSHPGGGRYERQTEDPAW